MAQRTVYMKEGEITKAQLAKLLGCGPRSINRYKEYGWITPVHFRWGTPTLYTLKNVREAVLKHRIAVTDEARAVLGLEQPKAA